MRLIDGDRLLKLFIATMEVVKENPKMTGEERHIICAMDTVGEMIRDAPTVDTLPPNDPLTLEQLREMDGEPVWVVQVNGELRPFWMLVDTEDESAASRLYCAMFEDYGTEWLAYRRKPEGPV